METYQYRGTNSFVVEVPESERLRKESLIPKDINENAINELIDTKMAQEIARFRSDPEFSEKRSIETKRLRMAYTRYFKANYPDASFKVVSKKEDINGEIFFILWLTY